MIKSSKFIKLIFIVTLLPVAAFAQSGKITGTVIDGDTGEPLIGATVQIQGTTTGSVTDLDGNYLILNVEPGTYVLEARYISYTTYFIQDVIVRSSLTTEQDFDLVPESFEGEEIVVVAERQAVLKDVTSSESRVSSAEIEKLPVQEVSDVVRLQAGVNVSDDGGFHIRGGRTSEVSYVVDGVRVTDDFDRGQGIRIENQSIQELQVISGTFNAEYGQAMSGIVNVVTKSGGNTFDANFRVWGGDYLVANKKYYDGINSSITGIDPTWMDNISGSISGPIIKDKLTFFITGRQFQNKGWLSGRNAYVPYGSTTILLDEGTDYTNFQMPYGDVFDENLDWFSAQNVTIQGQNYIRLTDDGTRDSSLVVLNDFKSYSLQGNIEYRVSNSLKFNLIGSYGDESGQNFNYIKKLISSAQTSYFRNNYSLNLKTTLTPSSKTFLTFNAAYRYNEFESYQYENPYDPRYLIINNDVGPYQFHTVGNSSNGLFNRSTGSVILKGEVSSQVTDRHFIKAGLSFQTDDIQYENISLMELNNTLGIVVPDYVPEDVAPYITMGIPPLETPEHTKFTETPFNFGAFIQDKIEYERLIINVGLRFDYFDANTQIPADPRDPDITNPMSAANRYNDANGNGAFDDGETLVTRAEREAYWWTDVDAKYQVSPRLGIAYPFSDNSVLHFSYGYFFQMPSYNFLFENSQILLDLEGGVQGIYGNPNLDPERSTQYELGVKSEIFEGTAVEVTAFYKDTRDYVSTGVFQDTYNPTIAYATWINRDYSVSKGLTFVLNQFLGNKFNFNVDYTYSVVEGSNSDPAAEYNAAVALGDDSGEALAKFIQPLDWDRNHIINATLFYTANTWGANLLSQIRSGEPYTPGSPFAVDYGPTASTKQLNNTARLPNQFRIDLNMYKNFKLGGADAQAFLNIFNILDYQIVTNVFGSSGDPDRPLPIEIGTNAEPTYFYNPTNYAEPRRIQIGIQLSF